jgi:UDP-3-O-[3-hydroxymyristoyl] N-acetylglucosamine deacetylase
MQYQYIETNEYETTIKQNIKFEGIGLHFGNINKITIKPNDSGIIFIKNNQQINTTNIFNTEFRTTIGNKENHINTIEHLMSALYGAKIDNVIIEVEGDEIPILDGSAQIFYIKLINEIIKLNKKRQIIKILKPIEISNSFSNIKIIPSDIFKITYTMFFDNEFLSPERVIYTEYNNYLNNIGIARTFTLRKDIISAKAFGIAKGGNLQNAIVIDYNGDVLNITGKRLSDEFARHKILDLLGDLYLIGKRLKCEVISNKSGHTLNTQIAQKIINMINQKK